MPEFTEQTGPPEVSAAKEGRQDAQLQKLKKRREQEAGKSMTKMVIGVVSVLAAAVAGVSSMVSVSHFSEAKQDPVPVQPIYDQPDNGGFGTPSNSKLSRMPTFLVQTAGGLTGSAVVIGLGLLIYARSTRRKYIQLDKIGILISDSHKTGEGDARFIPWGCLSVVDVLYPEKQSLARHEPNGSDNGENGVSNEDGLRKGPPVVVFYVDDGSNLRISWNDLAACIEPGTFLNELKTWAPDASLACKFPGEGEIHSLDKSRFTQLWFKYYSTASDRKRTSQLVEGETLQEGRYTIAGRLGSGGQGTAYLAVDNQAPQGQATEVVLKEYILPVHRGQQVLEQTLQKLHQEAAILHSISNKNIVSMLGEFSEDHRGYLIMEYVSGQPLKTMVAQEGSLPEKTVKELALQICDILECLHGMTPPVVHRDLTPDNLILQEDGIVKLVDFNVAHQLESAATATVVGKHCYIPPEQFRGKPTIQSDIYAFGCTLYYLLTAEDPEPLTVSHPRERNEHVSEELDYIVAACTSLDAAKRYADIAEVRQSLISISEDSSGHKIKVPKSSLSNA